VDAGGRQRDGGEAKTVAILRGAHAMAPNAETLFEAGGRLIVVTHAEAIDRLRQELEPW
jgi:Trk K+ transport system NAD-binding subunit